jgi:cytochrome d ubiquinol oxidase subunit I
VGGLYLWQQRHVPHARVMLGMATLMMACVAPLQVLIGDAHGLNTLAHQPAKVAAMEGIWETEKGAGLRLFGIPDNTAETTHNALEIPYLASLILTHDPQGTIIGLKHWPKEDRPPVIWVFFAFRVMVGIGLLMALLGTVSAVYYWRGKLFVTRWLAGAWMLMMPAGFVAILAGWFVTEIGRQPWTVYGVVRTAASVSPAITGGQVAWSLLAFVVLYTLVFGAGSYYILKLIRKGIPVAEDGEQYYQHGVEAAPVVYGTARRP